jgi:hypothetical protein
MNPNTDPREWFRLLRLQQSVQGHQYVYARRLVRAIQSGEFHVLSTENYENEYRQPGVEFVCEYKGRRFYLSENKTEEPSSLQQLIKVLKHEDGFDRNKKLIWPNRRGEECLYLEVWYGAQWFKFHTPIRHGPEDEFYDIILRVLAITAQ